LELVGSLIISFLFVKKKAHTYFFIKKEKISSDKKRRQTENQREEYNKIKIKKRNIETNLK
jgi:hypothetical protein